MQDDTAQSNDYKKDFMNNLSTEEQTPKTKPKTPIIIAIVAILLLIGGICAIIMSLPSEAKGKYLNFANYITSGQANGDALSQTIQSYAIADHSKELNDDNRAFYDRADELIDDFLASYKKANLNISINAEELHNDYAAQFKDEEIEEGYVDELEHDVNEPISNEQDSYYPTGAEDHSDDDKNQLTDAQNNLANQIATFKLLRAYFAQTVISGYDILDDYLEAGGTMAEFQAKYADVTANPSIIDNKRFNEYIEAFAFNSSYTMKLVKLLYSLTALEIKATSFQLTDNCVAFNQIATDCISLPPGYTELIKERNAIETELKQLLIYMANDVAKNCYVITNAKGVF